MASGGKKLTGKERADLQRKQIVDKVIEDMDKGGFEWVKPWHDMAGPGNRRNLPWRQQDASSRHGYDPWVHRPEMGHVQEP